MQTRSLWHVLECHNIIHSSQAIYTRLYFCKHLSQTNRNTFSLHHLGKAREHKHQEVKRLCRSDIWSWMHICASRAHASTERLIQNQPRNDQFQADTFCSQCWSHLPCREPVHRWGGCLCLCLPPPQFRSAVLAPRHRCWQATACDRPSLLCCDYFLLLPIFPLSQLHCNTPLLLHRVWLKQLTYLAVSLLIQNTSKQMKSSPVQRCRPAARASCQGTPHTCWLCTFPANKRQIYERRMGKKGWD